MCLCSFNERPLSPESCSACSTAYIPVCGSDGVQYANECVARCQGIPIADDATDTASACSHMDLVDGPSLPMKQRVSRLGTAVPGAGQAEGATKATNANSGKGGAGTQQPVADVNDGDDLATVSWETMSVYRAEGWRYVGMAGLMFDQEDELDATHQPPHHKELWPHDRKRCGASGSCCKIRWCAHILQLGAWRQCMAASRVDNYLRLCIVSKYI